MGGAQLEMKQANQVYHCDRWRKTNGPSFSFRRFTFSHLVLLRLTRDEIEILFAIFSAADI